MNYHAHIYWKNSEEREIALSLRNFLKDKGCQLGTVWDTPIGPHPLPMYQVMYDSSLQKEVEEYLRKKKLTILLHEDIGDDHVRDHTYGARWIGNPLSLYLDFLKQI